MELDTLSLNDNKATNVRSRLRRYIAPSNAIDPTTESMIKYIQNTEDRNVRFAAAENERKKALNSMVAQQPIAVANYQCE